MRSRAARWTFVTIAWIALVSAGFFLFNSQTQLTAAAAAMRAVDLHAREAASSLSDARVAQQAYVATGQGVQFWMPKVESASASATTALGALRDSTTFASARSEVDEAIAALTDFKEVDKRARDYMHAGQALMAADVIYTEGGQASAGAMQHVELARQSERQALDATEASTRKQQGIALGGAALLAALVALLLGPAVKSEEPTSDVAPDSVGRGPRVGATLGIDTDEGIVSHARPISAASPTPLGVSTSRPAAPPSHARSPVVLKAAADLATDFGRVRDVDELGRLLERVADLLDAGGLIVWLGDTTGGDLRPVLSHGYTPEILAKVSSIPRNTKNAAATAYRTGTMQIMLREPPAKQGAIVAPILGADGCIGALAAEINNGGEGSEGVQAVAQIVAAHLASVLAGASAESQGMPEVRAAVQR